MYTTVRVQVLDRSLREKPVGGGKWWWKEMLFFPLLVFPLPPLRPQGLF